MQMSTFCVEQQPLLEPRRKMISPKPASRPVISRRLHRGWAPLSFAQRQIWIIDQMAPGNPAYNMPYGYRLRGSLDLEALEKSFNEVVRRHETLRTSIAVEDGEPVQIIHPEFKISIKVTALDHLSASQAEHTSHSLASQLST
jgi:hypothetical protein